MERNNISFQYGIHRTPSAPNEGELAECVNLEAHNGELTPSVMPEVAFTLEEGDTLLFVHKSGSYKNYIIQRGTKLCWFPDTDKQSVTEIGDITPTSIHSVGNTLVILSENNMEYILFKSGYYKRIGNKPPFCSISFGLRANDNRYFRQYESIDRNEVTNLYPILVTKLDEYIAGKGNFTFDLRSEYEDIENTGSSRRQEVINMVGKMTELYHAILNRAKSAALKTGCFSDSFFIRYAYRMYDGSHYMHSAPCFIPICTDGYPSFASINSTLESGTPTFGSLGIGVEVLRLLLDYQIIGFYNGTEMASNNILTDWEDIIEGIDIFVTDGISKIKADSNVYGFSNEKYEPSGILYCGRNRVGRGANDSNIYAHNPYTSSNSFNLDIEKEEEDVHFEKIKGASLFYKIASFKTKQIPTLLNNNRAVLTIKEDTLTNLEQQEVLEDDYDSHNAIIPSFAHVYNGRLNISNIRTKQFTGFPMESMVPYTNNPEGTNYTWSVKTKLEIDGKEIELVSKSNIKLHEKPAYIFYPSAKVKEFTAYMYDNSSSPVSSFSATLNAETHRLLNGAFYLSSSYGVDDTYTLDLSAANPQPSGDPYISYPNKLYTSEVNNPFYFPLSGRNSVGTGEIIGITSNTQAISPGQFGQYPMIVFSSDGVWAMQTGDDGLYESIHPISRDICTNPNILQTDGPVLFATENGLHSIVGSEIENISKHIKGKPDSVTIPSWDASFDLLATTATDDETFNNFIQEASFAYDYANSRVLIFKDGKYFAYVLSTESGTISKLVLLNNGNAVNLASAINAYPEVYMQSGKDVYTFVPDKDITEATLSKGYIITRPLSFSDPLAMKVINDVRLIYHRSTPESKCRYAMFVSNDGHHWAVRNSLRGHSFKFFRFAIFTELADTDALQGMSVMFDFRRTNKLR